jgi:tRNA-intron endonuclease
MLGKLLSNGKVVIKCSNKTNRLHSKSGFGRVDKKNNLLLSPIEAAYLLENKKIRIEEDKTSKEIDFSLFLKHSIKNYQKFEIKYLVFRDLRKKGYITKTLENDAFDFKITGKQLKDQKVLAISEREKFDIKQILNFLDKSNEFLATIVDEEGDLTYYNISKSDPRGKIRENVFPKANGIVLGDRVLIFDKKTASELSEKEFFGKPFSEGIQLSFIEATYLLKKNILEIINPKDNKKITPSKLIKIAKETQPDIESRLRVYNDLKKRGLIVKTGFKFGTHFRAYEGDPDSHHAEHLVEVVDKDYTSSWSFISKSVRLAHSVRKNMLFAIVNNKNIEYISIARRKI